MSDNNSPKKPAASAATNVDYQRSVSSADRRFKQYVEIASDWYWEIGADFQLIYVSENVETVTGYDAEEFLGQRAGTQIVKTDPEIIKKYRKILERQEPFSNFERPFTTKDGHLIYLESQGVPIFDEKRVFQGFRGVTREITERIVSDQALKEYSEMQTLLHKTAQAANEARTFESALQSALDDICRYLGWPVGFAYYVSEDDPPVQIPTKIWHLDNPEKYDGLRKFVDRTNISLVEAGNGRVAMQGGSLWSDQKISVEANDSLALPYILEAGLECGICTPVRIGSEVAATLTFFSSKFEPKKDNVLQAINQIGTQLGRVIERERAEKSVKGAMKTAEIANRTKSEFLANMSHELRSPLTAIIGYAEFMLDESFGPIGHDKYLEYIDSILRSGQHLHQIINDILDVSALEAGQLELLEEVENLKNIVDASLQIVRPRAANKKIELINIIDTSNDLSQTRLKIDPRRMKQVFVNVLANAVKFTPEKGVIKLGANLETDRSLNIFFQDSGIGMDEKGIHQAMAKFGQIDSSLARQEEGTGLGLPLSVGLVRAHGGELSIESALGEGTTVTVSLPQDRIVSTVSYSE